MTTEGLLPVEYYDGGLHSSIMESDTFMAMEAGFQLPEDEHANTPTLEATVTLYKKKTYLDITVTGAEYYGGPLEEELPVFQWLLSPHDDTTVGVRVFDFFNLPYPTITEVYWYLHSETGWEIEDVRKSVEDETSLMTFLNARV